MAASSYQCCIAGGGPAGLMLGFLLARSGCRVVVLEKHADFLRDFRGDTIHPSTMQVMAELGLLGPFLKLPHQKVEVLSMVYGTESLTLADFKHLPVRAPYIAMMPQWDFLNFISAQARRYPGFELRMETEATGLITEDGRVRGVVAKAGGERVEIRAGLVVAADGRGSRLRAEAGLVPLDYGAPIDVLWFRLPRVESDGGDVQARVAGGRILILLNRGDEWQCAYVIAKGGYERVRAAGIEAFRAAVAERAPFVADRVGTIASFEDVKLLTVQVDRLVQWWKPGFLCIGDSAHAMSPIGGVGVNLAVQDAVAAANVLVVPLRKGEVTDEDLAAVQARRTWPVRATQSMQLMMQQRVIAPAIDAAKAPARAPLAMRLINAWPVLRRLPARLIGLGVQPEHLGPELRTAVS